MNVAMRRFRKLDTLPEDVQARMKRKLGIPEPKPPADHLHCGHPLDAVCKDDQGVDLCALCNGMEYPVPKPE